MVIVQELFATNVMVSSAQLSPQKGSQHLLILLRVAAGGHPQPLLLRASLACWAYATQMAPVLGSAGGTCTDARATGSIGFKLCLGSDPVPTGSSPWKHTISYLPTRIQPIRIRPSGLSLPNECQEPSAAKLVAAVGNMLTYI